MFCISLSFFLLWTLVSPVLCSGQNVKARQESSDNQITLQKNIASEQAAPLGTDQNPNALSLERPQPKRSRPWQTGLAMRRIGLRGTATTVVAETKTRWAGAGLVHQDGMGYFDVGRLSVRYLDFAGIGYGSAGLEGEAGVDLAGGIRIPVGLSGGVVVRLGLRGYLSGNDLFYASLFELPQLQVGYQWSRSSLQTEIAARGGYVLYGRYRVDAWREKLDRSPTLGAFGAFRVPIALFELSYTHLFTEKGRARSDSDEIVAMACATPDPIVACIDMRYKNMKTMAPIAISVSAAKGRSIYLGATFSLADMEWR
jgi:hypothetical protein